MLHEGDKIGGIEVRVKESGDSHRKVVRELSLIGSPLRVTILSTPAALLYSYVLAIPRTHDGQSGVDCHAISCSFAAVLL
jgi:hypothetical protein